MFITNYFIVAALNLIINIIHPLVKYVLNYWQVKDKHWYNAVGTFLTRPTLSNIQHVLNAKVQMIPDVCAVLEYSKLMEPSGEERRSNKGIRY